MDDRQSSTFANIGAINIILKRYDKAETALRVAIRLQPTEGTFHSELCKALSLQQKHTAAIEECETGVRLSPDSEMVHAARFSAMAAAGRNPLDLQRVLDIAVGQFRASEFILALASDYYLGSADYAHAAALLESLTRLKPNVSKFHGMLAEAYLRLGRDADSLAEARTALRLEPLNPYANYSMGLIFFELGQHEEAAESFRKIDSRDDRLKYARFYLAVSEATRGRHAQAIRLLREITAEYPDNLDFQFQLARALHAVDNYREAETAYQRANELKPKEIDIVGGLAVMRMMQAKFEQAIPLFEEALRLRPDSEQYKMYLNVARVRQGLIAKIPGMMREADADAKNVKVRADLVRALTFTNRFDEAGRYIDELVALEPEDDRIYLRLAIAFAEAGRTDKAVEAYRKSLVIKESPDAHLGLALIHVRRGEFDLASAAYARVIEMKPEVPNIMRQYADLLRDNGKRREALEMYKRSLALLPGNGPSLFGAGIMSMKLGDRDGAKTYLGILRTVDPTLANSLARCMALQMWN